MWADKKLLGTKTGDEAVRLLYQGDSPIGFVANSEDVYLYVKNLQGDVTGIADKTGTLVVSYTYDAWGNILSQSGDAAIAKLNPITYRGYNYDTETGLYYLQSRYYNSEWGRFLNADDMVSAGVDVLSSNMFAYCGNLPVTRTDTAGHLWGEIFQVVGEASFKLVQTFMNLLYYLLYGTFVSAINNTKWGMPNVWGDPPFGYDWKSIYVWQGYTVFAFSCGLEIDEYVCETKSAGKWIDQILRGYNVRAFVLENLQFLCDCYTNSGATGGEYTDFASQVLTALSIVNDALSNQRPSKKNRYLRDMLVKAGVITILANKDVKIIEENLYKPVSIVMFRKKWRPDKYHGGQLHYNYTTELPY